MTIELRYQLLPYLYAVVAQAAEYGWPVIRPIFSADAQHTAARSIDDSYLLGDSILVAPVVEKGAVQRAVYLPGDAGWYDFWTNEWFAGGQEIVVTAPLERLPLFVRAGAALPVWPVMDYVGQKSPGSHETVLYEDTGEGMGYQHGEYRWVYITTSEDGDKLIVNRRVAGSFQPTYRTISLEVVGLRDEPSEIRVDRQGAPVWFYDDDMLEIQVDTFRSIEITRKPTSSERTLLSRPW
jgi:alpha-glucosidase